MRQLFHSGNNYTTCPQHKNTHVKILENEQKQTDSTRECTLTWRKEDGALHKSVPISVAFGRRQSATQAVRGTSGVQVGKPAMCLSGLKNKKNEAEKLNAEKGGRIT